MGLTEYHRKRHFAKTPEPAGSAKGKAGWQYVIQKHDASHLHYDLRLELDKVLKSWAVPKGPSLDSSVKRLAVQVEDHPVEYASFEGIIPQGQYGGGTVLLWDTGWWEPVGDPQAGLSAGKLKFKLHGQKLVGGWTLVRTRRPGASDVRQQWLLIKERDAAARSADEGDILEDQALSVASGRDLEEIASLNNSQSSSPKNSAHRPAAEKPSQSDRQHSRPPGANHSVVAGGVKKPLPSKVDVQLATLTQAPPTGDEWLHEVKFDGYRMVCRIDGRDVKFISRNHQDWTDRMAALVPAVKNLAVSQAILDGEVVVLLPDGTSDFQSLQNAFRDGKTEGLKYFVFDLLYLNGKSFLDVPLETRKQELKQLLSNADDAVRFSDHIAGGGDEFKQQACRLHLEGMVSKRGDQPYRPGRGYDWLKCKCLHTDEFVIGGYTEPGGARTGFGALLLGNYDPQGDLQYAGKVGTGFSDTTLKDLFDRFQSLEQKTSPFADLQSKTGDGRNAHWLKPVLVGQLQFGGRTRAGRLRHASFQGLREDKPAREVRQDNAIPVETAVKKSEIGTAKKSAPQAKTKGREGQVKSSAKQPAGPSKSDDPQTYSGVRLTHPEKILYADEKITKLELAQYFESAADWILPHVRHRPLVLVRCPEGQGGECFYQKHPGIGTPAMLRQIPIDEQRKTGNYLLVDDVKGLIALAQISALEIHAWGSREDKLELPDRLIFDLDPAPEVPWGQVVQSARQIREFLQELGLESFVKTTGGKGLHVVIPIARRHAWDEAKAFCKQVAEAIERAAPSRYTSNLSKAARTGKIFIDYLRNGRGATAIVPYSVRAWEHATVSTPLSWNELGTRMTSDHFTIRNIGRRLSSLKQDPWSGLDGIRQSLTQPIKNLTALLKNQ